MNAHVAPPKSPRALRLNAADNLVVAVDAIDAGALAEGVAAIDRVPKGHKLAVRMIAKGEPIVKFGQIIGFAHVDISQASTSTPITAISRRSTGTMPLPRPPGGACAALNERATFMGYHRKNGSVGTRNYIAILTSVNCSATVARFVAEAANKSGMLATIPMSMASIALVHGTGCGMADKGEVSIS